MHMIFAPNEIARINLQENISFTKQQPKTLHVTANFSTSSDCRICTYERKYKATYNLVKMKSQAHIRLFLWSMSIMTPKVSAHTFRVRPTK